MIVSEFLAPDLWLSATGGPRYLQLRRRIAAGIAEGILPPNSPLPPERELASLTGLSRVTVRKATQAMVEDGLITQRQGSGSFVAPASKRVEQSLSRLTSFTEDMARRGFQSVSKWLERGVFLPSPEEVVALALGPDDSVARIARLRMADDRPMAIERAALPIDILPNPTEVTTSLYDVLEKTGNRPPFSRLCMRAVMKTVFPARDRPVTPSRNVGLKRLNAASPTLSSAIKASSRNEVIFVILVSGDCTAAIHIGGRCLI